MPEDRKERAGRSVEAAKRAWLEVGDRFYGRRWSVHDPIPRQRSMLKQAIDAFKSSDHEKAERIAARVIEECRTMSMVLSETNQAIDEAIASFRAAQLDPELRKEVAKLLIKAKNLQKVRKYPEAREMADRAKAMILGASPPGGD